MRPLVLVVDDDSGLRESLRVILEDEYEVLDVPNGLRRWISCALVEVDLVLLDVRLPGMDGITVLERMKGLDDDESRSSSGGGEGGAQRCRRDAVRGLRLPHQALRGRRGPLLGSAGPLRSARWAGGGLPSVRTGSEGGVSTEIVGHLPRCEALPTDRTGCSHHLDGSDHGESGTAPKNSLRAPSTAGDSGRTSAFVPVSLPTLTESLIESELFGHERGAFTGRTSGGWESLGWPKAGPSFWTRLPPSSRNSRRSSCVCSRSERSSGSAETGESAIDVRIIAATNVDLKQAVGTQTFRRTCTIGSTWLRINSRSASRRRTIFRSSLTISSASTTTSSRSRSGDHTGRPDVSPEYSWPGNVRELQNVIERSVGLVTGPLIRLSDLPVDLMLPDPGVEFGRPRPCR